MRCIACRYSDCIKRFTAATQIQDPPTMSGRQPRMAGYDEEEEEREKRRRRGAGLAVPLCCGPITAGIIIALLLGTAGLVLGIVALNKSNNDNCSCGLPASSDNSLAMCQPGEPGQVGFSNVSEASLDDCDGSLIATSVFEVPPSVASGTTETVCACVGNTSSNIVQYSVAIYADDGFGQPGAMLVQSDPSTLVNNSCNCQSLSLQIYGSQHLWLAFMTDSGSCDSNDNLYTIAHPHLRSGFADTTWPDWPATMPDLEEFSAVYSLYMTYSVDCSGPVAVQA